MTGLVCPHRASDETPIVNLPAADRVVMNHIFKNAALILIISISLLSFVPSAQATVVILPTDDEMVIGARAIVRGRVLSVASSFDREQDRVFTYTTLRVQEVFKGQLTERRIVIKEEGGFASGEGSLIYGTPRFSPGERVFLYLDTWPDGSFRVHQMFMGKFNIVSDARTGVENLIRSSAEDNVTVMPQQTHSSHFSGPTTNKMELASYVEMIKSRLSVNRERCDKFESDNYYNVPMLSRPPEYDSRVKSGSIHPNFTPISNAQPARWFEPDSGLPVQFFINPENAPNPNIVGDVEAAMAAWSNVEGSTLRVVNGGTASACTNYAGINAIVFNNCDGRFSPTPECSRIIALGGMRWTTTQTKVVNGVTFNKATRGFISFNPFSDCSFSNHCDIREITTHELGHALGLGHSQFADATMASFVHLDGRCASIKQDDIDGITFLYPTEDTGGGPLTITTGPLPDGVVGAHYFQVISATGGQFPYSWIVVPGEGRVPIGMSNTSKGHVSGIPTEPGTFNFTMRVGDGTGTIVDKQFSITIRPRSFEQDARFVSQSVPATVQANQRFNVSLKWLNTGTPTWEGVNGLRLSSQNPTGNNMWGMTNVSLAEELVPTGQEIEILFDAIAPATPGTYNFQWQLAQNGVGLFGQPSVNVSINVTPGASIAINSPAVLDAIATIPFNHSLSASGGTPPYNWAAVGGTLPGGITLNPTTGMLSGTPTASGIFTFTVQAADTGSRVAQKNMTINVSPATLTIVTSSLPAIGQGLVYNQALAAAGGTPPYSWSVAMGALPPGLNITNSAITGSSTASGNFSFTLRVTDSLSNSAQKALSINVIASTLVIQFAQSHDAFSGLAFNYQPSATGGTTPYNWSVTSGALPAGLSISPATGAITGTPTTSGTFNAQITVRDQAGQSAAANTQFKVVNPATLPLITNVKYKPGKKLIIKGERFNRSAVLLIDGVESSSKVKNGQFVVKKLRFTSGQHELKVINPGNVASPIFVIIVN